MKNPDLIEAATPANAVQLSSTKDTAKFIVILIQTREQLVTFPFEIQHADMLATIRQQYPEVTAISAGFFMGDTKALWVGGESLTLDLKPRPQDTEIVRSFLNSSEVNPFNFIKGGVQ